MDPHGTDPSGAIGGCSFIATSTVAGGASGATVAGTSVAGSSTSVVPASTGVTGAGYSSTVETQCSAP